jgi:cell division protein FtsN
MARARVYTPPSDTPAYRSAPTQDDGEGQSRQWLVLTIMIIVLATSGYVLWSLYDETPGQGGTPVIEAEGETFKQRYDGPAVDELATQEIDRALSAKTAPVAAQPEREEAPPAVDVAPPPAAPKAKSPQPVAAGAGGFVVQIAALRSASAADTAWERLARRDPALFAGVSKDVQRADLGGKGVYHRLRAGYFAERGEAARFCDRVKTLGQECIVVVR